MAAWSDDQTEFVRKLWREGVSAAQIGKRLDPPRSRCSVIGRMYRIGELSGDSKRASSPRGTMLPLRSTKRKTRLFRLPPAQPLPPMPKLVVVGDHKTLAQLGRRECRWPLTDCVPGEGDGLLFCAAPSRPGSAYCQHHHRRAWRPVLNWNEPAIMARIS